MIVLFILPVISDHSNSLGNGFVVGRDCSGFPARPEILSRIETKRSCGANGSGLLPLVLPRRKVFATVSLARVFKDKGAILLSQFRYCVHIAHLSVEVYRYNSLNFFGMRAQIL